MDFKIALDLHFQIIPTLCVQVEVIFRYKGFLGFRLLVLNHGHSIF